MATIRVILFKSEAPTEEGLYPIYLRLSDRGKRKHFATGFSARENQFVEGKEGGRYKQDKRVCKAIYRREADGINEYTYKEANDILSELEKKAKRILDEFTSSGLDWSFEMFGEKFCKKPGRLLFCDYVADSVIGPMTEEKRFKRAEIVRSMLKSLSKYDSGLTKRYMQDINKGYLEGYIKFCLNNNNKPNTVRIYLTEIRCILNNAINEGIYNKDIYPFGKDKINLSKLSNKTGKRYVSKNVLSLIANTTFEDFRLERAKHLFLFSFHTRGINWKDMSLMTNASFYTTTNSEGRAIKMIYYQRSKTKGEFDIYVNSNIQRELDWFRDNTLLYSDYVLPIIDKEVPAEKFDEYIKGKRKRFNIALKDIAKTLGLESFKDISVYWARHSFAMAMLTNGETRSDISRAMGHKSEKTTEIYLESLVEAEELAKHTQIDL